MVTCPKGSWKVRVGLVVDLSFVVAIKMAGIAAMYDRGMGPSTSINHR